MGSDIAATSVAFVLFALVTLVPGYVLSWALDLLAFRSRSTLAQCVIAVPVSIAACPVLTFVAWRFSLNAVWALYGTSWLVFGVLLSRLRKPTFTRRTLILCAIVAGWVVVGLCCLIDLQIGYRLYFPTVSYDYMLRAAITSSISRSGVPPDNPYFFPGQAFPLRYHYFWFLPCSLVDQLGASLVSARQAMIAGTLWCGIGLMSIVPLYLRFFQPKGAESLERRTITGIALFAVTGLDVLPIVALGVLRGGPVESLEWWNEPVMGWIHAVLWVPHHVAALIACLAGFLVLYHSFNRRDASRLTHATAAMGAGVMFASAVGLSIYVTFVFAVALGMLLVVLLLAGRRSEAARLVAAGVIAAVVSVPYLMDLSRRPIGSGAGAASGGAAAAVATGGAGPIFEPAVRPFRIPDAIVHGIWPTRSWLIPLTNLVLLPLNYFLELGLFSIVGIVMATKLRRQRDKPLATLSAITLALTSVLLCSFLRSSVITNNDLGYRGILLVQFILLIWAAELWDEGFFAAYARKGLIATLLVFGIAGTVYEVSMIRFYTLISDRFAVPNSVWFDADRHVGERTYALRDVYEELQRRLPANAVLQHNPNRTLGDVFHGLYSDRQVAIETPACGYIFGGDARLCDAMMPAVSQIFNSSHPLAWARVQAVCRNWSIDAVIVKESDPVWNDKDSWMQQPIAANQYARAIPCGAR